VAPRDAEGAACDEAKAALNGAITILYGCPTEVAK
jgi:hypothetical protein